MNLQTITHFDTNLDSGITKSIESNLGTHRNISQQDHDLLLQRSETRDKRNKSLSEFRTMANDFNFKAKI